MRNLDMASLRSFVAVADTHGVTRAAAQVNLTQSAVSMQIKRLEDSLDAKLLYREGRGVALTSVGQQLLGYARRIIELNDESWNRLTHAEFEGEVTLGVPEDIIPSLIPGILKRATEHFPRIRINLVSSLTRRLKQDLKAGTLDIILTTEEREMRGSEELLVLENNWYSAKDGKAWMQRPLPVALCSNCAQKDDVLRSLDAADVTWTIHGDADSEVVQSAVVSADLAVAPRLFPEHGMVALPSGALPALPSVSINMYTRQSDTLLTNAIADVIRTVVRCQSLKQVA